MAKKNILFSPPDITDEEIKAVSEALESGWITTGIRTKTLEKELAAYIGFSTESPKRVYLSSGTAAEEMNLRILGVGEGDEVLVPAYTYTASAAAAIHVGANVRFIDSQTNNCEMDYDQLEAAINEKTKAVIPVDLGGIVCDYERIYQAVENKRYLFKPANRIQEAMGRVAIVADSAHALGASRYGVKAGAIADFTSFSFHAVKNFTTAEGGAACWKDIAGIDNRDIYHEYQLLSLHGQSKDALAKTKSGAWDYDIIAPFYKCNMTDIMAAIGLVQLKRYPEMLERRRMIINEYDAACDRLGILHLNHYKKDHQSSGHLYITRLPGVDYRKRNQIIEKMADKGIACNVHYKPLPMMTAYRNLGWNIKDFPNAYQYYENEITLPLYSTLNDEDVQYVIESFEDILKVMRD